MSMIEPRRKHTCGWLTWYRVGRCTCAQEACECCQGPGPSAGLRRRAAEDRQISVAVLGHCGSLLPEQDVLELTRRRLNLQRPSLSVCSCLIESIWTMSVTADGRTSVADGLAGLQLHRRAACIARIYRRTVFEKVPIWQSRNTLPHCATCTQCQCRHGCGAAFDTTLDLLSEQWDLSDPAIRIWTLLKLDADQLIIQ